MPKIHPLKSSETLDWVELCIGTPLDDRHFDTDLVFSDEDVDVLKPNGEELLFALRPKTIPPVAYLQAYDALIPLPTRRRTGQTPPLARSRSGRAPSAFATAS